MPTARDNAMDCDTNLRAQVQSLGVSSTEYVVAITNTKHLKRFLHAIEWQDIVP